MEFQIELAYMRSVVILLLSIHCLLLLIGCGCFMVSPCFDMQNLEVFPVLAISC